MRISDWSSDVCSSDLPDRAAEIEGEHLAGLIAAELHGDQREQHRFAGAGRSDDQGMADVADMQREAERRRSFGLGEKQRRRVEMFIAFRAGPDRRQRDHMRQVQGADRRLPDIGRSEEHTSELQSLMRNSYAVFCLKKKRKT